MTDIRLGSQSTEVNSWQAGDPNEKPKHWIHQFFGGSRDFYGTVYTAMGVFEKKNTGMEIDGVLKILKPDPGSHILDWCGGWGRHAVPLAKRGYKVTLLDFSKEYLERADKNAQREGVSLNLVHADFRETPPEIQADYAVNLFTAGLGYIGEDNDILALKSLRNSLKPGSRILIDTMSLVWTMRNFMTSNWLESNDRTKWRLDKRSFDFMTNTINSTVVYCDRQAGKEMSCHHYLKVYSPADLARVLRAAEFVPKDLFGDFESSEFTLDSKRVVMTALRP